MKRPLAYLTAAWSGEPDIDMELAAHYCRLAYEAGFSPICPLLYLPLFLNDSVPEEHKAGIDMRRDMLRRSHTLTGDCLSRNAQTSYAKCPLWVINPKPSKGKGDDAEYPIRQRSSHSSPVGSNDSHGIYPVFQTKENSYCIPKLKFD